MLGYSLSMFEKDLKRVPAHRTKHPVRTFNLLETLGPRVCQWAEDNEFDPDTLVRRLPASVLLRKLTFDQICKTRYSQMFMMDSSVEELFRDRPEFSIVRKIDNSMWRWGWGSGVWNEVVDAYNGIRNFTVPVEGFDVRLDFTTGCNQRGYSRESRTFLDGVFGFLLYYKGEHVMTLGFSVMKGRRLLLQQVQLTQRKGNRFLFKLPANRLEFFLHCFAQAFPHHTLCIADGGDICRVSLASYTDNLETALNRLESNPDARYQQDKEECESKIAHLSEELPRLERFYANCGEFVRGKQFKVNGIHHYHLHSPSVAAASMH